MDKNIVVKELELLMEYGRVFTSFNVTKELRLNGHSVTHNEVANEVRRQFYEGLMDDFDYDVIMSKDNVKLNDTLYTAAIYYPKENSGFYLPLEIKLTEQDKRATCCSIGKIKRCGDEGVCGHMSQSDHTHLFGELNPLSSKVQELKKQIEVKYCVVRIIETKSDGRLEIPQDLLKKHFNGNLCFTFVKRDDSSFYVSLPTNNILAKPIYSIDCFDGRVRIPKTVFKMLKLPTDQYSKYAIHYNPKVNSFIIESND